MANNHFNFRSYIPNIPRHEPGHFGAYHPPSHSGEVVEPAAVTNHGKQLRQEQEESSSDDEANIDPQLRSQPPTTQVATQIADNSEYLSLL